MHKSQKITASIKLAATPHEVYEALLDAKKHSDFTGEEATSDPVVGGQFTAYSGYITGKHKKLVADKIIVQEWRGDEPEWPVDHFSQVLFTLKAINGGTLLEFEQTDVPEGARDRIEKGWQDFYWEPLTKKFGALSE